MFQGLNLYGYPESVDYFYCANKALKQLEESIHVDPESGLGECDYCLILSDLNMPQVDGYTFVKRARLLFERAHILTPPKVVAVTGNVERAYINKCYECKFDQMMSKPIRSDQICLLALEQNLKIDVTKGLHPQL